MSKNKKTPRQQMKYWRVRNSRNLIKARTARTAVRKFIRNGLDYHIAVTEFELWNPGNIWAEEPEEILKDKKNQIKKMRTIYIENIRVDGPYDKPN